METPSERQDSAVDGFTTNDKWHVAFMVVVVLYGVWVAVQLNWPLVGLACFILIGNLISFRGRRNQRSESDRQGPR
ncbi:MAG TPA: hypothetical protein VGW38_00780 [Chloroflexota bacterium]|nr:hypothetical protein [Chloroflexota bacterium]